MGAKHRSPRAGLQHRSREVLKAKEMHRTAFVASDYDSIVGRKAAGTPEIVAAKRPQGSALAHVGHSQESIPANRTTKPSVGRNREGSNAVGVCRKRP
jgi:hypothetical protein